MIGPGLKLPAITQSVIFSEIATPAVSGCLAFAPTPLEVCQEVARAFGAQFTHETSSYYPCGCTMWGYPRYPNAGIQVLFNSVNAGYLAVAPYVIICTRCEAAHNEAACERSRCVWDDGKCYGRPQCVCPDERMRAGRLCGYDGDISCAPPPWQWRKVLLSVVCSCLIAGMVVLAQHCVARKRPPSIELAGSGMLPEADAMAQPRTLPIGALIIAANTVLGNVNTTLVWAAVYVVVQLVLPMQIMLTLENIWAKAVYFLVFSITLGGGNCATNLQNPVRVLGGFRVPCVGLHRQERGRHRVGLLVCRSLLLVAPAFYLTPDLPQRLVALNGFSPIGSFCWGALISFGLGCTAVQSIARCIALCSCNKSVRAKLIRGERAPQAEQVEHVARERVASVDQPETDAVHVPSFSVAGFTVKILQVANGPLRMFK